MKNNVNIKFTSEEGKELSMGDVITISNGKDIKDIEVSWDNLPFLIKHGLVKSMKVDTNTSDYTTKVPMDVDYYINKVAIRMGWHYDKVVNYLNTLADLNPVLSINVILKEIALEMEKHYSGHIKDCKEVYVINTINGKVTKCIIPKDANYQCFAAFRTKEDAELAKEILEEFYEDVYGESED